MSSFEKRARDAAFGALDGVWRVRNAKKPSVLIYTDSRGLNVSNPKLAKAKRHYGSHVAWLQRHYLVDHVVCPYSHTTIPDFLTYAEQHDLSAYSAVILQCGIVDFSPRPVSSLDKVRAAKHGQARFDDLFARNADFYATPYDVEYEGEPTTSLYDVDYFGDVLSELAEIPNLLFITPNRFVPGWDGNWRPRPSNIDPVVELYSSRAVERLDWVLDLREWDYDEIQRYTVDNIHFTRPGFRAIEALLEHELSGRVAATA